MEAHVFLSPDSQNKHIPDFFTSLPVIRDQLVTDTSKNQDQVVQACLPGLLGSNALPALNVHGVEGAGSPSTVNSHGVPRLERERHITFLRGCLRKLPSGYTAADASRPWMLFWALLGLHLLGQDISGYRDNVIASLRPLQNRDGGFGGGHGHLSHCAATYAAVLSLLMVGGEALDVIDRKAMWQWMSRLKQEDGGFALCIGGEEDVRGTYCAMTVITVLDLPRQLHGSSDPETTFAKGLPEYIRRCQTYEGGVSASPGNEAHGGYTFCALATLCMVGEPHKILKEYIDIPSLVSWLSARQYAPEGGFSGRTNKLVDGCYCHWVGGCWALIEAAMNGPYPADEEPDLPTTSLFSREGVVRYILCCCQGERGGLRDKPGKWPDSYHTSYILSGLSAAQYTYYYADNLNRSTMTSPAYSWAYSQKIWSPLTRVEEEPVYDEVDRVNLVHPVFTLPWGVAEQAREYYQTKKGF